MTAKVDILERAQEFRMEAPDLSVLKQGRRDPPTFPLSVLRPRWRNWVSDTAQMAGAPVDYVAGTLLLAATALIGNSRAVSPWPGWQEPSVLWMGLVGEPSAGKSPAMDPIHSALRSIEAGWLPEFEGQRQQWEASRLIADAIRERWDKEVREAANRHFAPPDMPDGAIAPDEPTEPRLIVSDATIEALAHVSANNPKGLCFWRDELAGFLGSLDRYGGNGGDRAFWIEAFGARPYTVDRRTNNRTIQIRRLAISAVGGIQPDRLSTMLLKGDDDGFAARFLWVWPEKIPPTRPGLKVVETWPESALERLSVLMGFRNDAGLVDPVVLSLTPEAADAFQEWREEHDREHHW